MLPQQLACGYGVVEHTIARVYVLYGQQGIGFARRGYYIHRAGCKQITCLYIGRIIAGLATKAENTARRYKSLRTCQSFTNTCYAAIVGTTRSFAGLQCYGYGKA